MNKVYRSAARPAAAVIASCGAVAAVILLVVGEPEVANVDPVGLLYTLVAILVVFGVIGPAIIAVRSTTARPTWSRAVGFFLALIANAVTLSGRITEFPQTVLAAISVALSLAMTVIGVIAVAENQSGRPSQSRF